MQYNWPYLGLMPYKCSTWGSTWLDFYATKKCPILGFMPYLQVSYLGVHATQVSYLGFHTVGVFQFGVHMSAAFWGHVRALFVGTVFSGTRRGARRKPDDGTSATDVLVDVRT